MRNSSLIRSARWELLGSAALALLATAALAEAPVRSTQVGYARGGGDQNGYSRASIGLNYKFIRCDNEIHLAYSLDNNSVRVSDTYSYNGKEVMAAAPAPTPPTIALSGRVTEGGSTTTIATVSDGLAAPALGYGCFSGQTKRVGPVPAGSSTEVDAYLDSLIFTPSDMPQLLRNGAVENTQATAERAERQQLAAEKEKAEQAAAKRTEQARLQAAKVQSAKKAKALADAKEGELASSSAAEASRPTEKDLSVSKRMSAKTGDQSLSETRTADELRFDSNDSNSTDSYFFCVSSNAYSPIYRIQGDVAALEAWSEKMGWRSADNWLALMYSNVMSAESAKGNIRWTASMGSECIIDNMKSIQRAHDGTANQTTRGKRDFPNIIPWKTVSEGLDYKNPSASIFRWSRID